VTGIAERVESLRKRIETAARSAGREADAIRIVGISKSFSGERVLEAAEAGLRCFGESRVQEASKKIPWVDARSALPLEWHLVGQLQRNKAPKAVELFSIVESLDRPELAEALARAAAARNSRMRVLLQVNIEREPQKGGVEPESLPALLARVDTLEALEPLGLMAIPRHHADPERSRAAFAEVRRLRDALDRGRPPERRLRVLSMGMSHDFEVAIQEGADWIRIGTAIFGERSRA
jgi:hypothetical protein